MAKHIIHSSVVQKESETLDFLEASTSNDLFTLQHNEHI